MALYFIGADKEVLQGEIMRAGAVPAAVRLCSSSHPEVQAEAADVLKVRNSRVLAAVKPVGGCQRAYSVERGRTLWSDASGAGSMAWWTSSKDLLHCACRS